MAGGCFNTILNQTLFQEEAQRHLFGKEFITYDFKVANCELSSILLLRGLCIF